MWFTQVRENRVFPSHVGIYGFYGLNMGFVRVKYGVRTGSAKSLCSFLGFGFPGYIYIYPYNAASAFSELGDLTSGKPKDPDKMDWCNPKP